MKRISVAIAAAVVAGCASQAPPPATGGSTPQPAATTAAAASAPAGLDGNALYQSNCSACHGPDAKGIDGLGKTLVGSKMMKMSDKDLVEFVKKGRDPSDKENTTGIAMPPKGGNAALTDEQIGAIVTHLKGLK